MCSPLLGNLLALGLLLSAHVAGAAKCQTSNFPQEPGTAKNQTICVGKTERSYVLFLPANYKSSPTPRSLILSYHARSRTATSQLKLDLLTTPFFNNDNIIVYPQGIENMWQGAPGVKTNDILFTTTLLKHLSTTHTSTAHRIDSTKIYATGKSQGGGFVGQLACHPTTSSLIAAFAAVSGAFYTTTPADDCDADTVSISCKASRLIPFLEFHGGKDDTISYEGGERRNACLPSIPHYLRSWAERDDFTPQNVTSRLSRDVQVHTFGNGMVTGYYDRTLGHDWPSTKKNSDNGREGHGVASFNASSIIMEFFGRYTLGSDSGGSRKVREEL
ncbi:hypothetical protein BT63DRAFT_454771 [Microthyrium microscopicum]|uniref:feruloyl esterase n=1 Tax=Microthyrium microscopicum TaxID=703497 RepID=A0A6A6UE68_9PEZI|nr:hypothetical protein BT63DRAFT_454771 [Microthyrium microscopicum]